jgi:hypothetical protein
VITTRHNVHAGRKDLLGSVDRDAGSAGGILAVGNDEVHTVLLAQFWQEFFDGAPAGLADDVSDEEQLHACNVAIDRESSKPRLS